MNEGNYGFIYSIGSQEIYIGTNDDMAKQSEILDQDPEVFYDYTFGVSKEFAIALMEMSTRQKPHYKVIDLLETK